MYTYTRPDSAFRSFRSHPSSRRGNNNKLEKNWFTG